MTAADRVIKWTTGSAVLGVAAVAAVASYEHAYDLVRIHGESGWAARILPVGEIQYQGRTLRFTPVYLQGLVSAWQQRAYDTVPLQFADAANTHTNDPERTRGRVTDMELADDGLWITAELTPRGQQVLSENPYLGVSARIVEQFQRGDGQFFPAAIQHILGTLDPRIPGLGAWQEVQLSNESALTIDLSSYSFAAEPTADDELTGAELADLISVLDEVEDEDYAGDEPGYASAAAEQFDAAFTEHYAAQQDREEARAAAIVEDVMHPARRQEDKIARAMHRAADGICSGQQADFAAEQAAVEIALSNGGYGPCGTPDEYGQMQQQIPRLVLRA